MTRSVHSVSATVLAHALLFASAVGAAAQGNDGEILGLVEYRNSCATCHGIDGRGDGPLANELQSPPPDLTRLEAENGGIFPVSYVYEVIAHSFEVDAHGTTDMPAWGLRYDAEAERLLGKGAADDERQDFVTFRILSLIEYLQTLQSE